jgi:hypothetical protein
VRGSSEVVAERLDIGGVYLGHSIACFRRIAFLIRRMLAGVHMRYFGQGQSELPAECRHLLRKVLKADQVIAQDRILIGPSHPMHLRLEEFLAHDTTDITGEGIEAALVFRKIFLSKGLVVDVRTALVEIIKCRDGTLLRISNYRELVVIIEPIPA